jgi:hypothetical protein
VRAELAPARGPTFNIAIPVPPRLPSNFARVRQPLNPDQEAAIALPARTSGSHVRSQVSTLRVAPVA